jgi:4-amino-4-deoxy-L-arabinose transferase-like glycosyltransferase
MTKNSRLSFVLAILILMAGAAIRLYALADVPLGLNSDEVTDLRLAETVRQGGVRVFFDLNGEGREVLYPALLATVTAIFGAGTIVYSFASFVVGMITQAVTFALARRLFGDLAGLAALGFMALVWWPVMLSRLIGRETLLPLLAATVLLMLALGLPVYGRHRTSASQTVAFAGLGTAMAVGMYLHPVGIVVMLMALVFIGYYMAFGRPRLTDSLRRTIGFTVLLTLIFIVPYLLSAGNMPDLSGAVRLFTGLRMDETPLYERAVRAFAGVGIQGDMNPVYNVPGRPLIDPLSALIIGGGALVALRYARRRLRYTLLTAALIILAPIGLFAPNSPSWLAGAVLMPVLALCFGLGISALGRLIGNQRIAGLILAILLVTNGAWTTRDLFFTWPVLPAVQARYSARVALLAQHVDHTASDVPTLICSSDVTGRNAPAALTNPRLLGLMLNNRTASLRYLDCATSMIFPAGGEQSQVIFPNLRIFAATSPAVLQWIELGSRDDIGVVNMQVVEPLADRTGLFTTTAPVRLDPQASPGSASLLPPIRLENNLTFLGYETLVDDIQPGGILPVVTYWRVDGVLPSDLTLFAHLYDDLGAAPLANQDSISVVPSQLLARDVFVQVHFIQIPETMPERAYTIAIGAYRTQSRQRLGILPEPGGASIGSRLILYNVDVTRNP